MNAFAMEWLVSSFLACSIRTYIIVNIATYVGTYIAIVM